MRKHSINYCIPMCYLLDTVIERGKLILEGQSILSLMGIPAWDSPMNNGPKERLGSRRKQARGTRLSSEGREGCLGPHNPSCALSRFTDEEAGQRKAKRVATITRT